MVNFIKELFDKQKRNKEVERLLNISDEEWFSILSGDKHDAKLKNYVSSMPSEEIQLRFTGTSGKDTLVQGFDFYKLIKLYASKFSINLSNARILDFGVGWGRMIRFFVKDVIDGEIYGVDPLAEIIELCKSTIKATEFYQIEPKPSIVQFKPNTFDLIYAYSVFSHINEEYTRLWLQEFYRLLKDDGLLIITTRSRAFIEHCAYLRASQQNLPIHAQTLNKVFVDTQKRLDDYDRGIFCHQATGGGDVLTKDFFGESCISKKYFLDTFSDIFIVEDFIDQLPFEQSQACVILKKKNTSGNIKNFQLQHNNDNNRDQVNFRSGFHTGLSIELRQEFEKALKEKNFYSLKKLNAQLADDEEQQNNIISRAMPQWITVGNTTKCNLSCIMCQVRTVYNKRMSNPSMSKKTFEKIANECFPFLQGISLTVTGEPFLDDKLAWIFDEAMRYQIKVNATTNGTVIDNDVLLSRLENVGALTVSFDAFNKETYEGIRIGAHYEQTIKNIKIFNEFRKQLPQEKRPLLSFYYVMMKRNIKELPDFITLAKELEADHIEATHLIVFFDELKPESLIYHKELANKYMGFARDRAEELGIPLVLPSLYEVSAENETEQQQIKETNIVEQEASEENGQMQKIETTKKLTLRCPFLWKQAWIDYDGSVAPCCTYSRPIAGNINDTPFEEIWNGKVYQALRRGINTGRPLKCCQNCYILMQQGYSDNEDAFIVG